MRRNNKIFVHIPKTAGSSFLEVIKANETSIVSYKGLKSMIFRSIDDGAFIKGHMPYGVDFMGFSRYQYITFLRNPIEQCISWYHFVQEWHKHPNYHDAKQNSIIDFYGIKKYQNPQTKYIGGHLLLPNNHVPINYLLRTAKKKTK